MTDDAVEVRPAASAAPLSAGEFAMIVGHMHGVLGLRRADLRPVADRLRRAVRIHLATIAFALATANVVGLIEIPFVFALWRAMRQAFRLHALLAAARARATVP